MKDLLIQNYGKHHFYQTALAAQENNLVFDFITIWYTKYNKLYTKIGKRFISEEHLTNRHSDLLNDKNIISIWWLELLNRYAGKSKFLKKYYNISAERDLFDYYASIICGEYKIFHASIDSCQLTMEKLKMKGTKILLDYKTMHIDEWIYAVEKSYKDIGLPLINNIEVFKDRYYKETELADYLLCPSDNVINSCLKNGVLHERIIRLPYGIDTDKFRPKLKTDNVFRVGFVGGYLTPNKGVQYLIEAFNKADLPNSELVLVGHFDEQLAKKIDIGLKCKIVDFIPNNKLPDFLSQLSVFVSPSVAEGSSLAVLEAMAMQLPIIVSSNASGIITDKKDGLIVDTFDSKSIENNLKYLYEDNYARESFGCQARMTAEKNTWDDYRKNLFQIYKTFL